MLSLLLIPYDGYNETILISIIIMTNIFIFIFGITRLIGRLHYNVICNEKIIETIMIIVNIIIPILILCLIYILKICRLTIRYNIMYIIEFILACMQFVAYKYITLNMCLFSPNLNYNIISDIYILVLVLSGIYIFSFFVNLIIITTQVNRI